MSDLPRDPAQPGGEPPADPNAEPLDTELDETLDPEEPEPELDEDGNPIEVEPEPDEPSPPAAARRQGPRGRPYGETIREQQRQIDDLRQQLQARPAPQPQVDTAAQRAAEAAEEQRFLESLELMSPAQAAIAAARREREQSERRMQQYLLHQQVTTQETLDRQAYDSQARTSKIHEQYRARVERMVADERARGNFVNREVALKYLLGEDAIARANRAAAPQRKAAAGRVAAQQVRTGSPRGDAPATGRRPAPGSLEADEALLRDAWARGEITF